MLKRDELAVLDRAIGELGSQSYLGPWLLEVRAEVEALIVSDLQPALMPSAAVHQAQETIAEAKRLAGLFRSEADKHAEQTAANMRARVDDFRARARRNLEKLAGEL